MKNETNASSRVTMPRKRVYNEGVCLYCRRLRLGIFVNRNIVLLASLLLFSNFVEHMAMVEDEKKIYQKCVHCKLSRLLPVVHISKIYFQIGFCTSHDTKRTRQSG